MKKITSLMLIWFICSSAFSQTSKNNWLAGGAMGFSSSTDHYYPSTFSESKTSIVTIAPNFGYFFINNLAGGLSLSYIAIHTSNGPNSSSGNTFSAGPFARYYFNLSKSAKIFAHANIAWGSEGYGDGQPGSSVSSYGFKAGPAFFLNPHVALEITAGYNHVKTKNNFSNDSMNEFAMSIGFQIHLGNIKN